MTVLVLAEPLIHVPPILSIMIPPWIGHDPIPVTCVLNGPAFHTAMHLVQVLLGFDNREQSSNKH